jgi:hypothetical protein
MACRNDLPQNRLWGRLDPSRRNEKAVTHDSGCVGGADLSCPAGFYQAEQHSGSYSFPCIRKENTCYRSPDSYLTPLARCCTDGADATLAECAPGYCPASTKCAEYMQSLCSTRFADEGPCKTWCTNRPGQCDAGAIDYCSRNPADPFCACLRSPLAAQGPNAVALPSCFDGKCIAVGYKTAPMLSTNCPSVCQQALNCWQGTNGSCQIDGNQFQLNCGGPLPAPLPAPLPSPAPSGQGGALDGLSGLAGAALDWAKSRPSADWLVLVLILVLLAAAAVAWGAGAGSGSEPAAAQAEQTIPLAA